PFTHGTPFRRASEEGLLDLERCQHMGIRGPLYAATDLEDDAALGFQIVRADDYETDGVGSAISRMRRRLGDGPVYVSIDIDVLDPAHAPGTGTPEAGGLTSRELLHTLRGLVGLNVVGAAIVESLAAHGVDVVFGIPGTHNLELYRHLPSAGIRAVTTRHEQGAGYAADGYHQVSGRPGVVITTSGPALFNVAAAAGTAYAESRPLLIISPGLPRGTLGGDAGQLHETKDASGALDRIVAWSRRVDTPAQAAAAVTEAFAFFAAG